MECPNCPIQKLLDVMNKSRFEDRKLCDYPDLAKAVGELCIRCSRGCRTCKVEKRRQALRKRLADKTRRMTNQERDAIAEELRKLNDTCASHCTHSADDNPSNHGQTFVSLDSGTCYKFAQDNRDSQNIALGDYLEENRVEDVHEQDPEGCTKLPPNVEETLKLTLATFNAMSFEDQNLILCLMKGITIADYGAMTWVPESFTRPMTKQAAHARYTKIVGKMPVIKALAFGRIGKGKGGGVAKHEIIQELMPGFD